MVRLIILILIFETVFTSVEAQSFLFWNDKELYEWSDDKPIKVLSAKSRINEVRIDRENALLYVLDSLDICYRLTIPTLSFLDRGLHYKERFDKLPKGLDLEDQRAYCPDHSKYARFTWTGTNIYDSDHKLIRVIENDILLNSYFWINNDELIACDYASMYRINTVTAEVKSIGELPAYSGDFYLDMDKDSVYYVSGYISNKFQYSAASLKNLSWEDHELQLCADYSSFTLIDFKDHSNDKIVLYQGNQILAWKDSLETILNTNGRILKSSRIELNELIVLVGSKSPQWHEGWSEERESFKLIKYNLQDRRIVGEFELQGTGSVYFEFEPSDWKSVRGPSEPLPKLEIVQQNQLEVSGIHFSTKGNYFITNDDLMTLWDARSMRQIRTIDCKNTYYSTGDIQISEDLGRIACMCKEEDKYGEELRVFDLASGLLLDVYEGVQSYNIDGFDLERDFLYGFMDGKTTVVHLSDDSDEILSFDRLSDVRYNANVGIYSGRSDKGIQLLSSNGRHLFHVKQNKSFDFISDYELSSDGKYLLIVYPFTGNPFEANGKSLFEVYSVESGKIVFDQELYFGLVQAKLSLDSKNVYYLSFDEQRNADGSNYLAIRERNIMTNADRVLHAFDPGVRDAPIKIGLMPNGRELIYTNHDQMYKIELNAGLELMSSPQGISNEYTVVDMNAQTGHLYTMIGDRVYDLNLNAPNEIKSHEVKTKLNYGWKSLGNGMYLITGSERETENGFVFNYIVKDLNGLGRDWKLSIENKILDQGRYLKGDRILAIEYANEVYSLSIFDLNSGLRLRNFDLKKGVMPSVDLNEIFFSMDSNIFYLPVSENYKEDYCLIFSLGDKLVLQDQIKNALLVVPTNRPNEVVVQFVDPYNKYGRVYELYDIEKHKTIRIIGTVDGSGSHVIVDERDEYLIVAEMTDVYKFPLRQHTLEKKNFTHSFYYPLGMKQFGKDKYVVFDYNSARIYDNNTDTLCYSFMVSKNSSYIIHVPGGYYYTPESGNLDFVSFTWQGSAFPYDEFDVHYNRPDVVMKTMGVKNKELIELYHKAYLQRLKRLGLQENNSSLMNKPELEINVSELPVKTANGILSVPFTVVNQSNKIVSLEIWVNNVHAYVLPYTGQTELNIELSKGGNRVQIACNDDQGNQSLRETFNVYFEPEVEPLTRRIIITMACSSYEDSIYNLNYATKDAADIHTMFATSNVQTEHFSYLDRNAVKSSIRIIDSILQKTSIHDEVIIFLSGHGLLDENNEWWFATHDIDFKSPRDKGVAFQEFDQLLLNSPSRKKLMLIDACNSGEFDSEIEYDTTLSSTAEGAIVAQSFKGDLFKKLKEQKNRTSFEIMKEAFLDISKGSGAHIISATSGNSYAFESNELKNGVFTYVLRDGLMDLKADSNKDKLLTVLELKKYLEQNVLRLTDGKQRPTVRRENLASDFILKTE